MESPWTDGVQEFWLKNWLREIRKDMNGKNKQAPVKILEKLKILKKIPNWKALDRWGLRILAKEFYQLT